MQLFDAQIIMCATYSMIIYSGYKIHKFLTYSKQMMSKHTISVQNQLTKIMLLQAIYPAIDLVIPVSICCLGAMFNLTIPYIGIFLGTTMSLVPILNSLIILW